MEFALRVWNKWATLPYFVLSAVVAYITTIECSVYCCFSLASIFIAPMYCALIHSVNYTAICSSNVWASEQHICMNERINNKTQTVRRIYVYSYIFLFWIYFPFTIFYQIFSVFFFFAFIFFVFGNFSINIVSFSLIMPIYIFVYTCPLLTNFAHR